MNNQNKRQKLTNVSFKEESCDSNDSKKSSEPIKIILNNVSYQDRMKTCYGCINDISNQEGHIQEGGCLYDKDYH